MSMIQIKDHLTKLGLAPEIDMRSDNPIWHTLRCAMDFDRLKHPIELSISQFQGSIMRDQTSYASSPKHDFHINIWYWQFEFTFPFIIAQEEEDKLCRIIQEINPGLALPGFYYHFAERKVKYKYCLLLPFPELDLQLAEHLIGLTLSLYDAFLPTFYPFKS